MFHALNSISVICCTIAFLAAIWIIVPAPADFIWLFAVAASEWSLWIGIVALVGVAAGILVIASYGSSPLPIVSSVMGVSALLISLYPLLSVIRLAKENNAPLSISHYFATALSRKDSYRTINFSTYTFLEIEGKKMETDVYLPTKKTSNNGASVIVVHGGSWNGGKRNDFTQWNAMLAEQGFTVFDIDYSLGPQPNYLSATGDVKCAVQWVKTNSAKLNIGTKRIALMGRSAGAHLALLAAYSAGNGRIASSCPNEGENENVSAVISFYAPVNLLWSYDNPANQMVINGPLTLANFLGGSPHESEEIRARYILATPSTHISNQTPPTLMVHGGRDQLVRPENMQFLDEKLTEANMPHQTVLIPYAQHGFDYKPNGWGSQIAESVMLNFLKKNTKTNR